MRVLLPVLNTSDIRSLKAIAPDAEFYAGIVLDNWAQTFGEDAEMNRMSAFGDTANAKGIEALRLLCNMAGNNELYLTMNAPSYSVNQLSFLDGVLNEMHDIGLSGIIIGDSAMVRVVRRHGLKAVASTMIGVYNADIAKWCVSQGFQRIILPRDLSLKEMQEIITSVPNTEYECFLMRNGCRYSDGHCLARHGGHDGALCTYMDRSLTTICGESEYSFLVHDEALFNHQIYAKAFHKSACGMCAIWRLLHMGVAAGKVVGRADGINSVRRDVEVIQRNIAIALKAKSEEEYFSRMLYPQIYEDVCFQGLNCYYPEVRYP